jgi:hypothetical protein
LNETMGVMLRFSGVSLSRDIFEHTFERPVVWAQSSRDGLLHAQIDLSPEGDIIDWQALISCIQKLGPSVSSLITDGLVTKVELDIGLPFYENNMMSSLTLPAELCAVAGQNRIAITTTYYLTATA